MILDPGRFSFGWKGLFLLCTALTGIMRMVQTSVPQSSTPSPRNLPSSSTLKMVLRTWGLACIRLPGALSVAILWLPVPDTSNSNTEEEDQQTSKQQLPLVLNFHFHTFVRFTPSGCHQEIISPMDRKSVF